MTREHIPYSHRNPDVPPIVVDRKKLVGLDAKLFRYLYYRAGEIVSKEELLEEIGHRDRDFYSLMARLKRKLTTVGPRNLPDMIEAIKKGRQTIGYRLNMRQRMEIVDPNVVKQLES